MPTNTTYDDIAMDWSRADELDVDEARAVLWEAFTRDPSAFVAFRIRASLALLAAYRSDQDMQLRYPVPQTDDEIWNSVLLDRAADRLGPADRDEFLRWLLARHSPARLGQLLGSMPSLRRAYDHWGRRHRRRRRVA